jgi:hypothetical protein
MKLNNCKRIFLKKIKCFSFLPGTHLSLAPLKQSKNIKENSIKEAQKHQFMSDSVHFIPVPIIETLGEFYFPLTTLLTKSTE